MRGVCIRATGSTCFTKLPLLFVSTYFVDASVWVFVVASSGFTRGRQGAHFTVDALPRRAVLEHVQ